MADYVAIFFDCLCKSIYHKHGSILASFQNRSYLKEGLLKIIPFTNVVWDY